jgi:hypothetical protein
MRSGLACSIALDQVRLRVRRSNSAPDVGAKHTSSTHVNTVLLILTGAATTIALCALFESVYSAGRRPKNFLTRLDRAENRLGWERIYSVSAALGYVGLVAGGVYTQLFWIPDGWGYSTEDGEFQSARVGITALLTLISIPGITLIERLAKNQIALSDARARSTFDRKTLDMASRMVDSMERSLGDGHSSESEAPESSTNSEDYDNPWVQDHAKRLRFAVERIVSRRLARGPEKPLATAVSDDSKQSVLLDPSIQKKDVLDDLEALSFPKVASFAAIEHNGWVLLADHVYVGHWDRVKRQCDRLISGARRDPHEVSVIDVTSVVLSLPGLRLPKSMSVVGSYDGTHHGGSTDFAALLSGERTSVLEATRFSEDVDGLCSAFFIAHILPTAGRHWHGLYDFDYSFFSTNAQLATWLLNSGVLQGNEFSTSSLGQPAGLRIRMGTDSLYASALGAGRTTALTEFTIEVKDGRLVDCARRAVVKSRVRTFY